RPGVTRANQWVRLGPFLEILDTPGMLPPRLDDQQGARLLAYLGAIRDEIMDAEDLAGGLMALLNELNPAALRARYKLPENCGGAPHALLEAACRGRGWLLSGGRCDTVRAAALVLDEFRAGKVGKITIERA
ncbi:MAG: ribosome biogenesis GTPase YlqF, partial [Clostridia bacterium]|nr:ribosome biogenesis GTPase YlqF [Clostridia bacterium]